MKYRNVYESFDKHQEKINECFLIELISTYLKTSLELDPYKIKMKVKTNFKDEISQSSIVKNIHNDTCFNAEEIKNYLEENDFILNKLSQNMNNICKSDIEISHDLIWTNLKKLTKSADNYIMSHNLDDNNDQPTHVVLNTKRKRKPVNIRENGNSGLYIIIDKSILNTNIKNNF